MRGSLRAGSFVLDALALALLFAVLALPDRPELLAGPAWAIAPLELPILCIVLTLALRVSAILSGILRGVLLIALAVTLVVRIADIGMFGALNRPFNFAFDLPLIDAGWNVFVGSTGYALSLIYLAGGLIFLGSALAAIWWATGRISRLSPLSGGTAAFVMTAALVLLPKSTLATRVVVEHGNAVLQARADVAELERDAAHDDAGGIPAEKMLAGLKGRDVIFAFVESYGRSTIDNPVYADTTQAALRDIGAQLKAHGLEARSAWLTSPTFGGQSWLAHSTFLSGLRIDSEGRYGALMRSQRKTLLKLGREAGWRTVGVMPAITQPWPEGDFYGYDKVLAAADLGYRGKPFNWVTMPDQFTWSALERLELQPSPRQPVMAEVALISSHAPWTPIPRLIPWDAVGDGHIFDAQASEGPSPQELWADPDAVRAAFGKTIDYALRAIAGFAVRRGESAPLIVVLGDHQPASFVSGTDSDRDVPIHIIGDAATLLQLDSWGWTEGMLQNGSSPVWKMEAFRDQFLRSFSRETTRSPEKDGPA